MCLVAPGRVVAVDESGATVEIDGRLRRAATFASPEVRVGDWVTVGAGAILRRLDAAEAAEIQALIRVANGGTAGSLT